MVSSTDVAAALQELLAGGLLDSAPNGVSLTELGRMIAQSGLAVRSAVRVATALRHLNPTELNRVTLVAAAQLTDELDDFRLPFNSRGATRSRDLLRRTPAPPDL